jgi:hypothetical protein
LNFNDIETAAFKSKFPPIIKTNKPENNKMNVFKSIFLKVVKIIHESYIV